MDKTLITPVFRAVLPYEKNLFEDYAAYRACYQRNEVEADNLLLAYRDFKWRIEAGNVIAVRMKCGLHAAHFGIQLLEDRDGGFLSIYYFFGHFRRSYIWPIVQFIRQIAIMHRQQRAEDGAGKVYVGGRGGWRRIFERAGVPFDGDYIIENNGGLEHGFQRWVEQSKRQFERLQLQSEFGRGRQFIH